MNTLIVIPARMDSKRFPGKPLAKINDKPLLWHTYRAAKLVSDHVVISTPDDEILGYCRGSSIRCSRSDNQCPTGTHRCYQAYEIARHAPIPIQYEYIINWQVDEPLIVAQDVMEMLHRLDGWKGDENITTLVAKAEDPDFEMDRNRVKARVFGRRCIDFTRAPLPLALEHVGIYAFSVQVIGSLCDLNPTELSEKEGLEQLAWLEHGYRILGSIIQEAPPAVNVPDDIPKIEERLLQWSEE